MRSKLPSSPPMKETELDFCVPLLPPSVNNYVRHTRSGRHYVTGEATAFKHAIEVFAGGKVCNYKYYAITICITLGPKERLDIDNCAKVVLDGLVRGGQIHSDAAVTQLTLRKYRGPENSTRIMVVEGAKP